RARGVVDNAAVLQAEASTIDVGARYTLHDASRANRLPQVLGDAIAIRVAFADPDDVAVVIPLPFLAVAALRVELRLPLPRLGDELLAVNVPEALADPVEDTSREERRDVHTRDL